MLFSYHILLLFDAEGQKQDLYGEREQNNGEQIVRRDAVEKFDYYA